MRQSFALVPFMLLAACRTQRVPLAPLSALREVAVEYKAELGPQKGESAQDQDVARPSDPFQRNLGAHADAPAIEVSCQLVSFEERAMHDLAGPSTKTLFGHVVSAEEFERASREWRTSGSAEVRSRPALTLFDGGLGHISVGTHTSFVKGFVIASANEGFIGDPRIEVAHEGLAVEARSTLSADGRSVALDIALIDTRLMRPIEETSVRLPGTKTDIALQIPISFEQRLSAIAGLGADDVLVLGGLPTKEGRSVIACIRARRVEPDQASAPKAAALDAGRR